MITVERTVRSTTPIDRTWPFMSDFVNAEQWDPGTVTCKRKDAGPLDVGATYENVSEFRGRRTTLEYRVTAFEAPRHLALVGENKSVRSDDDMVLEPTGGGTTLTYTARFTFKGLARLAQPFLKGPLTKLADDTEAQLKRTLDAL